MRLMLDDGHALALRAITASLAAEECRDVEPAFISEAIVTSNFITPMFVGKRHTLALRLTGEADAVWKRADRLARTLPEIDLDAGRYFLAEARVLRTTIVTADKGTHAEIEVEALTLES